MGKYVADADELSSLLAWNIPSVGSTAVVEAYIEVAESAVDEYCHTSFDFEEGVTKFVTATNLSFLYLPKGVSQITEVEDTYTESILEATSYALKPDNPNGGGLYLAVARKGSSGEYISWGDGQQRFAITADWGYEVIPKSIKVAVALTAKYLFDSLKHDHNVQQEAGLGRMKQLVDVNALPALPRPVKLLLAAHVRQRGVLAI